MVSCVCIKTRIETENSVKLESRTGPFIPFVLTNTGLTNHFLDGFRRVEPLSELDLDKPIRLAVASQLDPGLAVIQILIKTKSISFEKICDVSIRP